MPVQISNAEKQINKAAEGYYFNPRCKDAFLRLIMRYTA
jgi:hypothetical protein